MRSFDSFACIDWSGAATQWQPGIAVAACKNGHAAPELVPSPQRHWTRFDILEWLREQADSKSDMLIGLDLSIGLPFDDRQCYFPGWVDSPPSAKAL